MTRVMDVWTDEAQEIVDNGTIGTPGAGGEIETTITIADSGDATTTTVTGVG